MSAAVRATLLVIALLAGATCAVWLSIAATRPTPGVRHEWPPRGPVTIRTTSLPPPGQAKGEDRPLPMPVPPLRRPGQDERRDGRRTQKLIVMLTAFGAVALTLCAFATIPEGRKHG